jgi:hypothetical protein
MRNMTGEGDLARYNLNVGGEMVATGLIARILEEDDSVLSNDQHTRKAVPFIFYSSSPGPSTCTGRELKLGRKLRLKVNGGLMTGTC